MISISNSLIFSAILMSLSSASYAEINTKNLTEQDNAALNKFLKSMKPNSKPEVIDLTVPENESGYIALLHLQGINEVNNPELFKDVSVLKETQKSLKMSGKSIQLERRDDAPSNYFGMPMINISENKKNATAQVLNSIYYPNVKVPVKAQDTLIVYSVDSKGNDVAIIAGGSSALKDKSVRYYETNATALHSNIQNNPNGLEVRAISTFQANINGTPYGPIKMQTDDVSGIPHDMINNAPERVKTTDLNKPIVLCLNRSSPEPGAKDVCDYGPMTPGLSNDDTHINMEIRGTTVFYDKIVVDENNKPTNPNVPGGNLNIEAGLTLIGKDTGGACDERSIDSGTFWNKVTVDKTGKKLSWNFSKDTGYADFGSLCWANNTNYILSLQVTVYTSANGSPNDALAYAIPFNFTNSPDVSNTGGVHYYPPIAIQYGCILEGTMIDMADGSQRKVEELRAGDKVLSKSGKILKIKSRTTGTDHNFVNIYFHGADALSLTPTHPVLTQRGIIRSEEVRVGDSIYTRHGQTTVEKIRKTKSFYAKNVYNFVLEAEHGNEKISRSDALLYAGGILVGDNTLQEKLAVKE